MGCCEDACRGGDRGDKQGQMGGVRDWRPIGWKPEAGYKNACQGARQKLQCPCLGRGNGRGMEREASKRCPEFEESEDMFSQQVATADA